MAKHLVLAVLFVLLPAGTVSGQSTAFTYQGQLTDTGVPATGTYDLQFKLFDDPSTGTQKGGTVTKDNVTVANGVFTVQLDFGAVFDGNGRYLEIGVRPGASTSGFQTLLPRQALTAAPSALFSVAPWATSGSAAFYNGGNVGIGTASPGTKLHVNGVAEGIRLQGEASGDANQSFMSFVDSTGTRIGYVGDGSTGDKSVFLNSDLGDVVLNTSAGRVLTATSEGNVGIGITNPNARLEVAAADASQNNFGFEVLTGSKQLGLLVRNDGTVQVGNLLPNAAKHACLNNVFMWGFAGCSSAAEYVPTADEGQGYPNAADLVSIASARGNPYGDDHAPFVVVKSTTSCDADLLGFVVDPALGADGVKLNDHYLPLAIYGYFPAKVTLENGPIKRGDPITSSSKPGFGMKSTGACTIIGYALEDADGDGIVQVFAAHGEHAVPEVAALRSQVQELRQANAVLAARLETLEEPNLLLQARLTALEQDRYGQSLAERASLLSLRGDWSSWGAMIGLGLLLTTRWRNRE